MNADKVPFLFRAPVIFLVGRRIVVNKTKALRKVRNTGKRRENIKRSVKKDKSVTCLS